jgi:hypothetical protein
MSCFTASFAAWWVDDPAHPASFPARHRQAHLNFQWTSQRMNQDGETLQRSVLWVWGRSPDVGCFACEWPSQACMRTPVACKLCCAIAVVMTVMDVMDVTGLGNFGCYEKLLFGSISAVF